MTNPPLRRRARSASLANGEPAVIIDSAIPDSAPPELREGLARRALVNQGDPCPCGATLVMPNRAERRAARRAGTQLQAKVQHQVDCPASMRNILAARDRWAGDDA
jgi:hypothetical protein